MSLAGLNEYAVEQAALEYLGELGYACVYGPDIAPEGSVQERASFGDVLLTGRLRSALARINPSLSTDAVDEAVRKVLRLGNPNLLLGNLDFHRLLTDGFPLEYRAADGAIRSEHFWLLDFDNPGNNDWLAVNQFVVVEGKAQRRLDIVVFVNGLPLGVIELKNLADVNATLDGAFNQLQNYKHDIPSLFTYNELLAISDGNEARLGTLSASLDRFMPWRTVDGSKLYALGIGELEVLLAGVFAPARLLDIVRSFVVFTVDKESVSKKIAGYHQYHAVNKAVASTEAASAPEGDRRVGVIWHTQGSGKSLSMLFYAGKVIRSSAMQNPTLLVLTDRNDLDDQLFATFSAAGDLLRGAPLQAGSKEHLRELLRRQSGGVIFTTIQKFGVETKAGETMPLLSERRNIIVIADEAHRSQYGLGARIGDEGQLGYGLAKLLRDALPNASFIGFTGTPVELKDRSTRAVFGDVIDTYDIQRSVEDKATVPIYYEARLPQLEWNEEMRALVDSEFDQVTESEEDEVRSKIKSKWAQLEALVGSEKRLALVAADIVQHFEARCEVLTGKGMIVTMSRAIAVRLYDEIVKLRPDWHSEDVGEGVLKIVMSGSKQTDPPEWQQHIGGGKKRRDELARRFKNVKDPLKLVIVRDMWLTGFDVPSLHTMYMDKPMQGHSLMQAIARVNRVFGDKPGGLVVDYIGLADQLRSALQAYSEADKQQVGLDQQEAADEFLMRYEVLRDLFHGFDYKAFFAAGPGAALRILADAMQFILAQDKGKERYLEAVVAMSAAFALAVPNEAALAVREDVALFQAIRASMLKSTTTPGKLAKGFDAAVRQIVGRALVTGGVMDVFEAAGLKKPDISILSDEFLAEVRHMPQRNLAVEALAKLLKDQVRVRFSTNVVQDRMFSDMLEQTLRRYQNRAIEAAQVIEELIAIAREVREASARGEQLGLSDDEVAFYDALADNESARDVLGQDELCEIARILVQRVKGSVSIDWAVRESVRARLRIMVKRILQEHGYPPDKQARAAELVLSQAERLSESWLGC